MARLAVIAAIKVIIVADAGDLRRIEIVVQTRDLVIAVVSNVGPGQRVMAIGTGQVIGIGPVAAGGINDVTGVGTARNFVIRGGAVVIGVAVDMRNEFL